MSNIKSKSKKIPTIKTTSQTKKIQYKGLDATPSSLTIDETIFNALEKKIGNAEDWCKKRALLVIKELQDKAKQMEKNGTLTKVVGTGQNKKLIPINVDEYVKGKISNGVRLAANREVIDARYYSE